MYIIIRINFWKRYHFIFITLGLNRLDKKSNRTQGAKDCESLVQDN
jgi:hypothetical protein